jgi:DNA-binding NarL/FixJ family response regulator
VRVVIAEDSVLLRAGLERLLADEKIDVVGTAGDGDELLTLTEATKPDLAIVDVRMPPTFTDEGLRAAIEARTRHPGLRVLVLSQYVEDEYARELLATDAEGVGYLLKDRVADVADFVEAVHRVGDGGTALDPEVVAQLFGRHQRDQAMEDLTPREREVLGLMAEGRSNRAIAEQLVISAGAVEKHITNVFAKLGLEPDDTAHRRVLAVLRYLSVP